MIQALNDMQLSRLPALMPEIYLCITTVLLLLYGVYCQLRASREIIVLGLIILASTLWMVVSGHGQTVTAMNGMFISDGFSVFAKSLLLAAGGMALLLASGWVSQRPFEYVALLLFSTLGMMLMVSANDLISLYMGLEMASLALYVLASFDRDNAKSAEAGLKYFVLGALASGMMLFGMSLIYGFAGTTGFAQLAQLFGGMDGAASKGILIGMVMMIVGFCFKISAVPFHMWAPDVYEGAPTPVTAFFATAPKIAALALFTRLLMQPFGALDGSWQQVIILTSMASMLGGALAAIMQTNIKRLLAYSSISHAGFILMGVASNGAPGVQAMLIYLAVYIFMSAGMFGCVLMMQRYGEAVEDIKDLSGLSQTNPLMAGVIALFMFSMAGIPPLAGFFGKMYVILAAVQSGLMALAIVGVLASVVGCYYYLKVVKIMYFDAPAAAFDGGHPLMLRGAIAIGALVTLLFCILPSPLVATAQTAAQTLIK